MYSRTRSKWTGHLQVSANLFAQEGFDGYLDLFE